MTDEYIDLVNKNDKPIGKVSRREMRLGNLWHRVSSVFVFHDNGQIFIQKRTKTKDVFPGFYDVVSASGVPLSGESYEDCARRELSEELGIENVELKYLFDFKYESLKTRCFERAFSCIWNGPVKLQRSELEDGYFVEVNEALEMIRKERFCPDGVELFLKYLRESETSFSFFLKRILKKAEVLFAILLGILLVFVLIFSIRKIGFSSLKLIPSKNLLIIGFLILVILFLFLHLIRTEYEIFKKRFDKKGQSLKAFLKVK
ncbi:MAG: NUDIX hydrolase [Candidatus Methanofastidiosia archaeon]